MPTFPKPKARWPFTVATEVKALRAHKATRGVPDKQDDELLVCTWNVANLGAQQRENDDLELIAEILRWFDVIALQECRDNFADLVRIVQLMGKRYRYVMSDAAGNDERMVFIYDAEKVSLLEEVGEIALPPAQLGKVKLTSHPATKFTAFDRNPYLASFQLGRRLAVQLVNVHLYYGTPKQLPRRAIETAAVARWCDLRRKSPFSGAREIIALGDFNMPKAKADGGNIVYDALTRKGLLLPAHATQVATAIASANQYDQVAIYKSTSDRYDVDTGVYDFDQEIFAAHWSPKKKKAFQAYLRYYISDHRPMWVRLKRKG